MIPALLAVKPIGDFLKSLPREVWYGLALVVILLILRSHWINIGESRSAVRIEHLKTANDSNIKVIKELQDANELFKAQSDKQVANVLDIQKELKASQKLADELESTIKKQARKEYEKNPDWANAPVPDGVKRLLKPSN